MWEPVAWHTVRSSYQCSKRLRQWPLSAAMHATFSSFTHSTDKQPFFEGARGGFGHLHCAPLLWSGKERREITQSGGMVTDYPGRPQLVQ